MDEAVIIPFIHVVQTMRFPNISTTPFYSHGDDKHYVFSSILRTHAGRWRGPYFYDGYPKTKKKSSWGISICTLQVLPPSKSVEMSVICSICTYLLIKVVKVMRKMIKVFHLFCAYLPAILFVSQHINLNESIISKSENRISKKLCKGSLVQKTSTSVCNYRF